MATVALGMIHCSEEMENLSVEVIGKAMDTNRPKKAIIDSMLVADAAEPIIVEVLNGLQLILERLPPELMMGIYSNTVAVGGTSRLRGIKERIFDEVEIPITVSDD